MDETLVKVNKKLFSVKLKTDINKEVYIIVQDNIDANSNKIGYSLFLPFITEQDNKDIVINNSCVKINGVRKLFGKGSTHIERDENSLVKYVRHIVFTDYDSAKLFIDFLNPDGMYIPKIMVGEIPENKSYFDFRDGILLAETFRLVY